MSIGAHPNEAHEARLLARLNNLRAAVLGANDGIVSEAELVIGVAGATTARTPLITAGLAGLAAGAVSMALGEYVSVSSQRDAERDQLALERQELAQDPVGELAELTALYRAKGLTPNTARLVAEELTASDALAAHAEAELHLDPNDLVDPIRAAVASSGLTRTGLSRRLRWVRVPSICSKCWSSGTARSSRATRSWLCRQGG